MIGMDGVGLLCNAATRRQIPIQANFSYTYQHFGFLKELWVSKNLVSWAEVPMTPSLLSIAVPRKISGMLRAMPSAGTVAFVLAVNFTVVMEVSIGYGVDVGICVALRQESDV